MYRVKTTRGATAPHPGALTPALSPDGERGPGVRANEGEGQEGEARMSGAGTLSQTDTFWQAAEPYWPELERFLRRLGLNQWDAEDTLQDVWLHAARAYSRLPADANLRAWLYRIAANQTYSRWRRRGRQDSAALDEHNEPVDARIDPAASADERELVRQIAHYVRHLPRQQRLALIARKYHDLDYGAIGELLGCSPVAARAHVYQAVKKLRNQFAPWLEGEKEADHEA